MSKLKPLISLFFGLAAAAAYGLAARLLIGTEANGALLGTLTLAFFLFVPLAVGALTIYFAPVQWRHSWLYAGLGPWISCLVFAVLAALFSLEAWICVVMALPIFLVVASIGGLLMKVLMPVDKADQSQTGVMGALLVLPFLVLPLEQQLPNPDSIRVVHSQIEVAASPAEVWSQITRVAEINEAERPWSFFHTAGLPRPRYATLTHDGVGGVRHGQWEDGLAFVETITEWQPNRAYTMWMEADTRHLTASPLPLQQIGGTYFDVIEGRYEIKPVAEGQVILHFTSTHRLSTRFNFYGGWWTDFFMRDVQNYILRIVKARAEGDRV
jgi:hypothetical protein